MRMFYTLLAIVFVRLDARKAKRAEKSHEPFVQKRARKAPGAIGTALMVPVAITLMGVDEAKAHYAAFRSRRAGKPTLVKRSRVIAGGVALALVAGTAAAGAQAATPSIEPGVNDVITASADAAVKASSNASDLSVTVGKTVAQTTNQAGDPTPLSILLINGQISGQGSGEVTIPLGPNGDKVVPINSNAGEVQNFTDFGGFYHEPLPVTVETKLTMNGEEVDPDQGYNLTGDAEVTYVFTNHTSRMQDITFQDLDGNSQTKSVEVPVPFGVSFSTGFGQGWDIVDAPNMEITTLPTATNLSSTVVLFPIIQGAVGGTTQTLTIKARAQNAALPGTKSQAVPINLATYQDGLALQVNPLVQGDLLSPAQGLLGEVVNPIMDAGRLISGFIGAFETVNNEYVDPILADIQQFKIDPEAVTTNLDELSVGLRALATVQQANRNADYRLAEIVKDLAGVAEFDGPKVVKFLDTLIKSLGGPNTELARDAMIDLQCILLGKDENGNPATTCPSGAKPVNIEQFAQDEQTLNQYCSRIEGSVNQWGAAPLVLKVPANLRKIAILGPFTGGTADQYSNGIFDINSPQGAGAWALGQGIAAGSGQVESKSLPTFIPNGFLGANKLIKDKLSTNRAYVAPLQDLASALDTDAFGAATMPSALIQLGLASGQLNGLQPVLGIPVNELLEEPLCQTMTRILGPYMADLQKYLPAIEKYLPDLINALDFLVKVANNPNLSKWESFIDKGLNVVADVLDKPCKNSQVIDPLLAAFKKYGPSGIKDPKVLIPLALSILENCGVAQVLEVLGDANELVGELSGDFADFVDDLITDLPQIIAAAGGISQLAGGVRTLLNTAPGAVNQLLGQVEGGVLNIEGKANSGIEDISSYAAQLGATLEAMNARSIAGDGDPFGGASGPATQTVTVYQITQEQAAPYTSAWFAGLGLALAFLIIAVGVGTWLYRRRRNY